MSNDAFPAGSAALPAGVRGHAAVEFEPLVRNFARIVGGRTGAGGGLTVHRHGEPVVEVWTGYAEEGVAWTRDTGSVAFSATKGIASTVVHRLADRGLIDYAAPVAEYWPEFGAAGKSRITVAQLLTHRAGLSSLPRVAGGLDEVLDHELMEHRLAAAAPDRLLGVPAYHALTYGWLLAGLARAVTGTSMRELFRVEVAEPLGLDGLHLGRPEPGSATTVAALAGSRLALAGTALGGLILGQAGRFPGPAGAATRALFLPGLQALFEGADPSILATEMPAGNGVFTANALASVYGVLADDGMVAGRRYLSAQTMRRIRRVQTRQLDHALFYFPMLWHLGYHTFPIPGAATGFGHIGLAGSFGWAEPRLGLSVGFVHNRFTPQSFVWDQLAAAWVLPLAVRGARAMRGGRRPQQQRAA
ncbi:serine hydrolase domain-containing protein [Nocardia sp. NPDC052254]|uniref:serine hydrolase domain-containing protein n=1 Tax=Nocardia sp. NPDC052254 TaxID=3155681 RepID=UPI0034228E29